MCFPTSHNAEHNGKGAQRNENNVRLQKCEHSRSPQKDKHGYIYNMPRSMACTGRRWHRNSPRAACALHVFHALPASPLMNVSKARIWGRSATQKKHPNKPANNTGWEKTRMGARACLCRNCTKKKTEQHAQRKEKNRRTRSTHAHAEEYDECRQALHSSQDGKCSFTTTHPKKRIPAKTAKWNTCMSL